MLYRPGADIHSLSTSGCIKQKAETVGGTSHGHLICHTSAVGASHPTTLVYSAPVWAPDWVPKGAEDLELITPKGSLKGSKFGQRNFIKRERR
jgi:hypothetical protein